MTTTVIHASILLMPYFLLSMLVLTTMSDALTTYDGRSLIRDVMAWRESFEDIITPLLKFLSVSVCIRFLDFTSAMESIDSLPSRVLATVFDAVSRMPFIIFTESLLLCAIIGWAVAFTIEGRRIKRRQ